MRVGGGSREVGDGGLAAGWFPLHRTCPSWSQILLIYFLSVSSPVLPQERWWCSVVDNKLDYQSRDRKIDPPLLRSFGRDFKPKIRLRMTSLLVGR